MEWARIETIECHGRRDRGPNDFTRTKRSNCVLVTREARAGGSED